MQLRSPWTLVIGDVAVLVAFGLLGLASHQKSVGLDTIARSTIPFVVSWLIVSGAFRMFGRDAVQGRIDPGIFLLAWLIAGTAAMIARAAIFDRELITAFFVIGIAGYGLFLAAWRFAYYRLVRDERPSDGTVSEGARG